MTRESTSVSPRTSTSSHPAPSKQPRASDSRGVSGMFGVATPAGYTAAESPRSRAVSHGQVRVRAAGPADPWVRSMPGWCIDVRIMPRWASSSNVAARSGLALCLAPAACGSSDSGARPVDAGPPSQVIAQANDFAGFCKWSSAPATPVTSAPVGIHGVHPMTVYWKEPPPHGATEFPVGTVILKESEDTTPTTRIVFAMVKRKARGAGFNPDGADGWEWFSLQDQGDCTVLILWRGAAPPVLTTYSDLLVGDCNGCHSKIVASDYVFDTALQLSSF
jgi:hypothetical protein